MSWIYLRSGGHYDFRDPDSSVVAIDELVWACSQICRFTGHPRTFSSVLQHMLFVERLLHETGAPATVLLAGLTHDLHEGLVGDVPAPLKPLLGEAWACVERSAEYFVYQLLRKELGVDFPPHWELSEVKKMDLVACATEGRDHLCADVSQWGLPVEPEKEIHGWILPTQCRMDFARRLHQLADEIKSSDKPTGGGS